MALAGTSDLRAHAALGLALRVIGRPRDRALRAAVADLRAWRAAGGRREDSDGDGRYEHANAVRIMDAWWPRWVRAQFQPVLGRRALGRLLDTVSVDDPPNGGGAHRGSAYQGSWYGYVRKDLRSVLGRKVRGRYARGYCGGGSRPRCRSALRRSLRAAARVPAERLYRGDPRCDAGDQRCWDSIVFRAVGGTTQPPIDWVNRPTYQQVVEVARRLPR
jgi:hypothetical protein